MGYVLVVDRDESLRAVLSRLLRAHGLEVRVEADGQAGLDRVVEREPRVIILDEWTLSVGDGELLLRLRRQTRAAVMVIGDGGEAAVLRAFFQGADMYIKRPPSPGELISRIRALLRRADASHRSPATGAGPRGVPARGAGRRRAGGVEG